ncbi:MAG: beta-glucosidase [Candidatus Latescibacteria bacterium]|nr:beta-glucosidase [Candidatus Latescibacterota bacterium]
MSILRFSNDFILGVATSAQQIEGAWDEDGRGESIWDRYAAVAGKIEDGSTPRTACDHYHRWREDVALLRWLGVGGYRFSTSWSRVMPTGHGPPNPMGLDFYERLVDTLLESGIEPFLTLNHWDMPQPLEDRGGWPERAICDAFTAYVDAVAGRLGDRVRFWATHNEPWCIASLGYEQGAHAPGRRNPQEALEAAHHLLLSHGLGVERIRELAPDAGVGIVLNLSPGRPATSTAADRDAVRQFDGFFNRWYLDPLFHGRYPDDAIADRVRWGHLPTERLRFVHDGDLARIGAPLDFLGVNYYGGTVLAAGSDGKPRAVPPAPPEERTEMGWEIRPSGLLDLLERLARDGDVPPLYVTENGAAFADPSPQHGTIADPRRVAYLRDHLLAIHEAARRGVRLRGYFVWTLLDNFEWSHGFTKRFGLFGLDPCTGERIPKDSAIWYRKTIADRAVDDEESLET